MSLLVVGSVALDSIETPFGRIDNALGGSATYFAFAASLYTEVRLVAVVGADFPQEYMELLRSREIDLAGMEIAPGGKTFRWAGRYSHDLNSAETLDTQLNVFSAFRPRLPKAHRDSSFVFLANIDPDLQVSVLEQVHKPGLTVMDTMNYWIENKREALTRAISMVDVVLMNEAEARQFGETYSLSRAAQRILALGPRGLIVKKGEYGAVLFTKTDYFVAPAYPSEEVKDPTGAGDTFAGGLMGYLAQAEAITSTSIKKGILHGNAVASYTVEDFGVHRLGRLTKDEVQKRTLELADFSSVETGALW